MFTVITFLFVLSLLVIVHEGGHFFAARLFGVRVYEFALGFPPRIVGWFRDPVTGKVRFHFGRGKNGLKNTVVGEETIEDVGTTIYTVNWLPLGGFVKIKGENGERKDEPDSFGAQAAWKRVVILCAGVAMNFLFAALVLGIGFVVGLPTDVSLLKDKHAIVVKGPSVVVQEVRGDSPAQRAGLLFGDTVLSVDGVSVENSEALQAYIREHGGRDITLGIERGGERQSVVVRPEALPSLDETPRIGTVLGDLAIVRYPWYWALPKGVMAASIGAINIVMAFGFLIWNLIVGQGLAFDVSGPVGIATVVGQSAHQGFSYLLNVTAMISLSLAVINILPIPALDGGRVLFVLIEKILRRPVPMKYEQLAHTVGFVLLMCLIVLVTWRDVARLL